MLTAVAEAIRANLETNKTTLLGSYESKLVIRKALDPTEMFEQQQSGLWVITMTTERQMQNSNKRGSIKQLYKAQIIAVALSINYETFTSGDVATWDEVEDILDMRERIDDHLCETNLGMDILEVNSTPPLEVMLKQRWFLSMTEYSLGETTC